MINNLHTVLINKEIRHMSCITKIHLIHVKSATLNTSWLVLRERVNFVSRESQKHWDSLFDVM